jgi:hypothetical protein
VYGLAGGKKTKAGNVPRHPDGFPDLPREGFDSPINYPFPAPPPAVPIRGTGNLPPLPQTLPSGMVGPEELSKRNQSVIVNRARRKAGLE